jgi:hypothetical protein
LTLFKNCVGQVQDAAEWIALEILQELQQTSILRKNTDLLSGMKKSDCGRTLSAEFGKCFAKVHEIAEPELSMGFPVLNSSIIMPNAATMPIRPKASSVFLFCQGPGDACAEQEHGARFRPDWHGCRVRHDY